ncbi:hypothetical protein EON81_13455 [bacterium]|nr:MAG: hypothetical protein EON81_13455 [bacterium]
MWLSSLDLRTCAMCWAMHGTVHPLSERFAGHIQDRCTSVPLLEGESPEDVGISPGAVEFAKRSAKDQRFILGSGKNALYQDGKIAFSDVVVENEDPNWGLERNERTLGSLEAMVDRRAKESGPWRPNAKTRPVELLDGRADSVTVTQNAMDRMGEIYGRDFDPESIARLVAAPNGAKVRADVDGDAVFVDVEHAELKIEMQRTFRPDKTVRHNFTEIRGAPQGTGLDIFSRQVANYVDIGAKSIDNEAAGFPGDDKLNGYFTWPRYGFNMQLDYQAKRATAAADVPADNLNDLFTVYQMKGVEWWRKNGYGGEMEFDLRYGSTSRDRLDRYLEEKGKGRSPR